MSVDGYLIATCNRGLKQTIGQYTIRHERSHLTNHLTVDHYEQCKLFLTCKKHDIYTLMHVETKTADTRVVSKTDIV